MESLVFGEHATLAPPPHKEPVRLVEGCQTVKPPSMSQVVPVMSRASEAVVVANLLGASSSAVTRSRDLRLRRA